MLYTSPFLVPLKACSSGRRKSSGEVQRKAAKCESRWSLEVSWGISNHQSKEGYETIKPSFGLKKVPHFSTQTITMTKPVLSQGQNFKSTSIATPGNKEGQFGNSSWYRGLPTPLQTILNRVNTVNQHLFRLSPTYSICTWLLDNLMGLLTVAKEYSVI